MTDSRAACAKRGALTSASVTPFFLHAPDDDGGCPENFRHVGISRSSNRSLPPLTCSPRCCRSAPGKCRSVLHAPMFLVWLARSAITWLEQPALSAMTLGIWTVIGLLAAALALRFAMRAASVDAEHLYAALKATCSAGFSPALVHWVSNRAAPQRSLCPGEVLGECAATSVLLRWRRRVRRDRAAHKHRARPRDRRRSRRAALLGGADRPSREPVRAGRAGNKIHDVKCKCPARPTFPAGSERTMYHGRKNTFSRFATKAQNRRLPVSDRRADGYI